MSANGLAGALSDCKAGDYVECVKCRDPSQAWTEGRKYLVHTHTLTFGRTELFVIDDKGQHRVWAGMLTRFVKSGDTVQEETVTEEPAKEVKKGWEPDTIREDIDIMESIRRASNRF